MPALQPFIGRETELKEIASLLANPACRMLTLVGPGGIGKTRLALEAAQQITAPNGVHIALFQPLTSPDFMVSAITETLGIHFFAGADPKQQLLDYLQDKTMLLVLDNLEHLLDGVGLFSEILTAAPDVRLLITSRERLNLREEWVLDVGGMAYPTNESNAQVEGYDAVRLFVQHAQRIKTSFVLSEENQPAVTRICRMVNGMPLAIELAATWVRVLSCEAIADEISHSLDILETSARNVEPRHRSMRAAFEPTWNWLTEAEQGVFKKLSVFRGGFTREAAEQVAGASLRILSALVDKSLLWVDAKGRYDIHELLRQYGDAQLSLSADASQQTVDAHCSYYADFMVQQEAHLQGYGQLAALNTIGANFDNVRSALDQALHWRNYSIFDRTLESLFLYCEMRGRFHEGKELLWRVLTKLYGEQDETSRRLWGRVTTRCYWLWNLSGWGFKQIDLVNNLVNESLKIADSYDDQREVAFCLWHLGTLARVSNDINRAISLLEQSLALFSALGDDFYAARAADWLGGAYGQIGQVESFLKFSQHSLDLRRTIADQYGVAAALMNLYAVTMLTGHYDEAKRYCQEMSKIYDEIGNRALMARTSLALAWVAFRQGEFQNSRTLLQESIEALRRLSGSPASLGLEARTMLALLAALDEAYARSWQLCEFAVDNTAIITNPPAELGLTIAACGLENYVKAKHYLLITLKFALTVHDQVLMNDMLSVAAILMAQEGKIRQAVEILGLVFHHPASTPGWLNQWPLLTRLRADLETQFGTESYKSLWNHGTTYNLEEVASIVLTQFQREYQPQLTVSQSANRSLIEPLSGRELEILRLTADGFNSREVAEQLALSVGTIRWYIKQIYSKLDVHSRSEALVRAREFNLLT